MYGTSEIETGITTKVEQSLNGIEGIKEITSKSSENLAKITNKLGYVTYDKFWNKELANSIM